MRSDRPWMRLYEFMKYHCTEVQILNRHLPPIENDVTAFSAALSLEISSKPRTPLVKNPLLLLGRFSWGDFSVFIR